MPSYTVKWNDETKVFLKEKIRNDIRSKLEKNLVAIDNKFAIENFTYVTEEVGNKKLAEVYQMLGPFDYS